MKKVKDILTKQVKVCRPETSLTTAAQLMWEEDCSVLPVVDEFEEILGIITDRDICIALGTNEKPAKNISVIEAMTSEVYACTIEDDIKFALEIMQIRKVNHILILEDITDCKLKGVLSLNDIAMSAQSSNGKLMIEDDVSYKDVSLTFKAICERNMHTSRKEPFEYKTFAVAS